jgi:3-isopropylmalate/(R)-2-methylmalate dehydratase small subunit
MQPVRTISGRAYGLGRDNIDTDVILPGRFLKTITRDGLGNAAFEAIRAEPDNVFDDPRYAGAPVLIAGENFGCGSSREHAVWAMMDMGIRAVVAGSYSDIFSGNAYKNGLLAVTQPPETIARLLDWSQHGSISIDLDAQLIRLSNDETLPFAIDPFRKHCLLNGLDEIGLTLADGAKIAAFEKQRQALGSWLEVAEHR